jgi:hypothetical protein
MTITSNDISFVYSGGSNNSDPSKSIGGLPSNNVLTGISNNLFTNLRKEDFSVEFVDYRCFYICNNSFSDTLYNASIYFDSQIEGVSLCKLGIAKTTDVQSLSLSSTPNLGTIKLRYENYITNDIVWNSNDVAFRRNIQEALNNIEIFSGIVVDNIGENVYSISFSGNDNYRNYSLLEVAQNNLSPSVEIGISKRIEGQPINSIAPLLATSETIPSNVVFYNASFSSKIVMGDLKPGDICPVWIQRTSFGEVASDEANGFSFRLSGNLLETSTQVSTNLSAKPCFYYE